MRLSCAILLATLLVASANGYQFLPSRGGPDIEDPAAGGLSNEPVVATPAAIVQIGPRPYYLVESMKPSFLKDELSKWPPTIDRTEQRVFNN